VCYVYRRAVNPTATFKDSDIDGAGRKINRIQESQQQPNNKTRSKASANLAEIQMPAGCTRLQQGYNVCEARENREVRDRRFFKGVPALLLHREADSALLQFNCKRMYAFLKRRCTEPEAFKLT
jgi:hypothetical protein